mmetsp:Transcript_22319/g.34540  ORF Transcript_22319/g.34540 Transcript_22319/m.34540 type:complete len:87 (+) Transcript_22319:1623-1883(+)
MRQWVMDICSDFGGFVVFAWAVFYVPCILIQTKLYYAQVMRDSYRIKFNKLLNGLPDERYMKKNKKKSKITKRAQDLDAEEEVFDN